jgi:hypothetical protein
VATRRSFGAGCGHVLVVGHPLLRLEVRILKVGRVVVGAVLILVGLNSESGCIIETHFLKLGVCSGICGMDAAYPSTVLL